MTQDTITQISLDDLHESPFNPRKTFVGIAELAANIIAEGRIHQPLLVRPRMANPTAPDPDDMFHGYEIVFGHRRYRAAEPAGLKTVPCMVRAMTDAEARSAQIAENLQRDDVHPIEEAEGFQALMDDDQLSADDIAQKVGKSRSYVYGRLKLLQACDEVRTSCLAGTIGSEVALLIARLRTPKLQEKALAAIRKDTSQAARLDDGGARSFRHIRDLLAEKFTLSLKDAIFPRDDATLLPGAGVCAACPKRTANAPEFADLARSQRDGEHRHYTKAGGPDVCTDPDCWAAKKQAHLVREADKLRAAGHEVVDGNKARTHIGVHGDVKGAFIALDDVKRALKGKGLAALKLDALGKPVLIQNPRDGKWVKALRRADLETHGVLKPAEQSTVDLRKARQEAAQRQRQAEEAKAVVEGGRRMALLLHVRLVAGQRERDAFDLRLVASAAFAGVGYHDKEFVAHLQGAKDHDALKRRIDTMDVAQLTALVMDCAIVDNVRVQACDLHSKPVPLLALAHHYGIDAKAVMAAAETAASTPSPAGASAEEGEAPAAPAPGKAKRAKASPAVAGQKAMDEAGVAGQRDLLAAADA